VKEEDLESLDRLEAEIRSQITKIIPTGGDNYAA